jgi:hypothetical protein
VRSRVEPGEAALRAYLVAGSLKRAAADLGTTEGALSARMGRYCRRHGFANIAQAAYALALADG